MLAANVARSLTAEGELDAALLLLLNGARWFDDASVPDELRIALTRALEKKSRIEVNILFPNMQVFETDAALLLVNPATHDIFKLTDSLSPDRLVKGSTADSPILKLRQSAQGDDVIVLRKNLEVERINLATGMRRKVGVFPQPQAELGGRNEEELDGAGEAEITHNGLVVREFSYERPNGEWGDYAQIMDAGTGRIVEGELPFRVAVYGGAAADGAIYVVPANEEKAFRLKPGADGFLSQEARLDQNTTIQQRYGNCVGGLKGAVRTAVLEKTSDSYSMIKFLGVLNAFMHRQKLLQPSIAKRALAPASQDLIVQMFLRGLQLEHLLNRTAQAGELLLGIVLQDQLADTLQQGLHAGSLS